MGRDEDFLDRVYGYAGPRPTGNGGTDFRNGETLDCGGYVLDGYDRGDGTVWRHMGPDGWSFVYWVRRYPNDGEPPATARIYDGRGHAQFQRQVSSPEEAGEFFGQHPEHW